MTRAEAFKVLQLEQGASPAEVRQAYLDLVKVWHPDRFQSNDRLREKADQALQRINQAYTLLQTPGSPSPGPTPSAPPSSAAAGPQAPPLGDQPPTTSPVARLGILSRRSWAAALLGSCIGVVVALFVILRPSSDEPVVFTPPIRPLTVDVELTPDTSPSKTVPPTPAFPRPESGTELKSGGQTGRGALSVRNDTMWDAVIVLRGEEGRYRALYLRQGEKVTLLDLAPSTYVLQLILGSGWTRGAFAKPAAFLEREEPLPIVSTKIGTPIEAVTLSGTRAGFRSIPAFRLE